eukprot:14750693-Alexandrium_andersonii.AAC.1
MAGSIDPGGRGRGPVLGRDRQPLRGRVGPEASPCRAMRRDVWSLRHLCGLLGPSRHVGHGCGPETHA